MSRFTTTTSRLAPWATESTAPFTQLRKKGRNVVEKLRYRIRRNYTWNLFVKKESPYYAAPAVINRFGVFNIGEEEQAELERLQKWEFGAAPRVERVVSSGSGHCPGFGPATMSSGESVSGDSWCTADEGVNDDAGSEMSGWSFHRP